MEPSGYFLRVALFKFKPSLCQGDFLTCISTILGVAGAFLRTWVMEFTGLTPEPRKALVSPDSHLGQMQTVESTWFLLALE